MRLLSTPPPYFFKARMLLPLLMLPPSLPLSFFSLSSSLAHSLWLALTLTRWLTPFWLLFPLHLFFQQLFLLFSISSCFVWLFECFPRCGCVRMDRIPFMLWRLFWCCPDLIFSPLSLLSFCERSRESCTGELPWFLIYCTNMQLLIADLLLWSLPRVNLVLRFASIESGSSIFYTSVWLLMTAIMLHWYTGIIHKTKIHLCKTAEGEELEREGVCMMQCSFRKAHYTLAPDSIMYVVCPWNAACHVITDDD